MHKKLTATVVTIGALAIPTIASASGDHAQVQFAPGTFSISSTSCKFVHPEANKPMGTSWAVGKIWAAFEDARHDQLMACNRARQTRVIACFAKPIPSVREATADKQGYHDEIGARAAIAAVRDIQTCVLEAGGLAP